MEIKIQEKLIQWLLQPLENLMSRFSDKAKEILFTAAGLMIFLAYFALNNGNLASVRYLYIFAFDCLMMGLMILSLMPKDLHPVHFDKILLTPWLIVGLFMLIAGITQSEDVLPDAMLFLVAYPVFYIIAGNCGFHKIMRMLLQTARLSFCVFLVFSFLFFPITGQQYSSFFHNTNGIAFYLVLPFCCGLIGVLSGERKRPVFFLDLAMAGISAAILYYSASRTGILSAGLALILTTLLMVLTDKKSFPQVLLRRVLPLLVSIVILIPATLYIFRIPQAVSQLITTQTMQPGQTGQPDQTGSPDPTVKPGQTPEAPPPSVSDVMADITRANETKFFHKGGNLNQFTSGRLIIWKTYFPLLSFWGHDPETENGGDAHQTILELSYNCGILAGVCYLLFNILAGLKSIRYALRRPEDRYALAPFTISITFGVLSALATTYVSFYLMTAFYYYLAQSPLMTKEGFECEP